MRTWYPTEKQPSKTPFLKAPALVLFLFITVLSAFGQTNDIDSLQRQLGRTSDHDERGKIYQELARAWVTNDPDSALYYGQLSYTAFKKANNIAGMAEVQQGIGRVTSTMGNNELAIKHYNEALSLFNKAGDKQGAAGVYNSIGAAYGMQEKYPEAVTYFLKALHIYEQTNDAAGKASSYMRIGVVYFSTNNFKKAEDNYLKAIDLAKVANDKKTEFFSYMNLGGLFGKTGQYKKALVYLKNSIALSEELGMTAYTGATYNNLGNTYSEMGMMDSALINFNIALSYFEKQKDMDGLARVHDGMGGLYEKNNQFDKARHHLQKSSEYARIIDNKGILYDNYRSLMNIHKEEGNYKESARYFDTVLALKDSLFALEKTESVEKIRSSYELGKKELQIEQLKAENDTKTRERNFLIGVIVIVVVLLAGLGVSILQTRKSKQKLLEQKQELEDLHKEKDKFFSILGHDLRSPMANILGVLDVIRSDNSLSEAQKSQLFDSLHFVTAGTLETMEHLLAWGNHQINNTHKVELVNVQEITERVCRFLKPDADNKSITINNQVAPHAQVMSDNNQLEFVLRNLVGNAIKFSHENSTIDIWATFEDDHLHIHVKDYGTGIRKELQKKLFDRRMDSVRGTSGERGTGLGLFLSNEFIIKNKGSLLVNSEPGKGSTFTIKHPVNLS